MSLPVQNQDVPDTPGAMKKDVYASTGTIEQDVSDNDVTVGEEESVSAGIMLNDASTPI